MLEVVGVSTDDSGNVVFTGDDYNTLVSQGFLGAGAGVVILVWQPELYPILTATIVVVGAVYITYRVAQYIKSLNYDRETIDYCRKRLVECVEVKYDQGRVMDCSTCYGYCTNNNAQWPSWDCPTTP
jgi:hypothetical protein